MAPKKDAVSKTPATQEVLMLGYLCTKDLTTLPEKVDVLDRFGLSGAEIAKICNASEGSIRNARLETKKDVKKNNG